MQPWLSDNHHSREKNKATKPGLPLLIFPELTTLHLPWASSKSQNDYLQTWDNKLQKYFFFSMSFRHTVTNPRVRWRHKRSHWDVLVTITKWTKQQRHWPPLPTNSTTPIMDALTAIDFHRFETQPLTTFLEGWCTETRVTWSQRRCQLSRGMEDIFHYPCRDLKCHNSARKIKNCASAPSHRKQ